ncbi:isochorismatase [Mariannaea sp. PMI_226]|nr:isochorismatase [Mariannaea sp. PMI_226]
MATPQTFRQLVGAPASTASVTDSTLIIIDAQNEYAEGKLKVEDVETSRKVIASLLQKYRKAKGEIVHVIHDTPAQAPVFTPGTSLAEVFEELTPIQGEKIVHKNFPSSFADTDLLEHLRSIGAKKIVLTGYMAHVCVSTTAREGARHGFEVLVVRDAVGDRNIPGLTGPDAVHAVLAELADAFATIVDSKDIN